MGTYVFLALLDSSVAVRVGNLGLLAEGAGDHAVDEAQDGNGAERDSDDSASEC